MTEPSRILIADDEETFLQSTADLLHRQGYQCDCVVDAGSAKEKLSNDQYDLLIADINMPGNAELELIRDMPSIANGVPVIVVTDYPFLSSAIQSIELRVEAYLVKPINFNELLEHVRAAIKYRHIYRSVKGLKQSLRNLHSCVGDNEKLLRRDGLETLPLSISAFTELIFQNIVSAAGDLKHVTETLAEQTGEKETCHLFNCPRLSSLISALMETIEVLEKSKSAFKSKDLGRVRQKLEVLINNKI